MLCEYAAHATSPGNKLVTRNGLGKTGPFFDGKVLSASLAGPSRRLQFAAVMSVGSFPQLAESADLLMTLYSGTKSWLSKYPPAAGRVPKILVAPGGRAATGRWAAGRR